MARKKPADLNRDFEKLQVDFSEIPKIFDKLLKQREEKLKSHRLTVNNVLTKLIELCNFFEIKDPNSDKLLRFACWLVGDEIGKRIRKK